LIEFLLKFGITELNIVRVKMNQVSEELEDQELFRDQFKDKCRSFGRIGHRSFHYKIVQTLMVEIAAKTLEEIIALIAANWEISDRTTLN
jgi:hypothetical protein